MAANQGLSYATKISFIRNKGNFHLQAVNFSSVKELRKATESCRNGTSGEGPWKELRVEIFARCCVICEIAQFWGDGRRFAPKVV